MKKKNPNDMVHPATLVSRSLSRSGITENGKELVVVCGYAMSGQFGYFVCWESQEPHKDNKVMYQYSDVLSFRKKVHERTLHEVLADFKTIVDSRKNK